MVKQRFLIVVSAAQAMVLLVYSMAGLGKIVGSVLPFLEGRMHAFSPEALSVQTAAHLIQTNQSSLLGPFVIEHPYLGWLLLLTSVYLQLFAFWLVFRPSLRRLWGLGLIAFHVGTHLVMAIDFSPTCLLLAVLLVVPAPGPNLAWRERLLDLPVIGDAWRIVTRGRRPA
jgi:hypothetical protein